MPLVHTTQSVELGATDFIHEGRQMTSVTQGGGGEAAVHSIAKEPIGSCQRDIGLVGDANALR
jgi:hypothetical protein